MQSIQRPTAAFVGASWGALLVGACAYLIGLWNAEMQLNEKGYYLTLLLYGLFAAVSLQKTVRDRSEGLRVTNMYVGLCWISVLAAILLLVVGLWNATLAPSEKGFYAMSFTLSLFAVVAVQKNVRDVAALEPLEQRPDIA
ncbi:MAG: inner membrane protein YiaA [Janthinobacterium lividum]